MDFDAGLTVALELDFAEPALPLATWSDLPDGLTGGFTGDLPADFGAITAADLPGFAAFVWVFAAIGLAAAFPATGFFAGADFGAALTPAAFATDFLAVCFAAVDFPAVSLPTAPLGDCFLEAEDLSLAEGTGRLLKGVRSTRWPGGSSAELCDPRLQVI